MNKKVRISLIASIAALLLLAIVAPALASPPSGAECTITWRLWNLDGDSFPVEIEGRQVSVWNGTTLTTTCTGNIPLGLEQGWRTYFTLDEARVWVCENWGACNIETPFFVDSDDNPTYVTRIDYKGNTYPAVYWSYLVKNNGDFVLERIFIIE